MSDDLKEIAELINAGKCFLCETKPFADESHMCAACRDVHDKGPWPIVFLTVGDDQPVQIIRSDSQLMLFLKFLKCTGRRHVSFYFSTEQEVEKL